MESLICEPVEIFQLVDQSLASLLDLSGLKFITLDPWVEKIELIHKGLAFFFDVLGTNFMLFQAAR